MPGIEAAHADHRARARRRRSRGSRRTGRRCRPRARRLRAPRSRPPGRRCARSLLRRRRVRAPLRTPSRSWRRRPTSDPAHRAGRASPPCRDAPRTRQGSGPPPGPAGLDAARAVDAPDQRIGVVEREDAAVTRTRLPIARARRSPRTGGCPSRRARGGRGRAPTRDGQAHRIRRRSRSASRRGPARCAHIHPRDERLLGACDVLGERQARVVGRAQEHRRQQVTHGQLHAAPQADPGTLRRLRRARSRSRARRRRRFPSRRAP